MKYIVTLFLCLAVLIGNAEETEYNLADTVSLSALETYYVQGECITFTVKNVSSVPLWVGSFELY